MKKKKKKVVEGGGALQVLPWREKKEEEVATQKIRKKSATSFYLHCLEYGRGEKKRKDPLTFALREKSKQHAKKKSIPTLLLSRCGEEKKKKRGRGEEFLLYNIRKKKKRKRGGRIKREGGKPFAFRMFSIGEEKKETRVSFP